MAEVGVMCSVLRIRLQNPHEFSLYNEKLSRDNRREIARLELRSKVISNPVLYGRGSLSQSAFRLQKGQSLMGVLGGHREPILRSSMRSMIVLGLSLNSIENSVIGSTHITALDPIRHWATRPHCNFSKTRTLFVPITPLIFLMSTEPVHDYK
jgi:hypothetical protein